MPFPPGEYWACSRNSRQTHRDPLLHTRHAIHCRVPAPHIEQSSRPDRHVAEFAAVVATPADEQDRLGPEQWVSLRYEVSMTASTTCVWCFIVNDDRDIHEPKGSLLVTFFDLSLYAWLPKNRSLIPWGMVTLSPWMVPVTFKTAFSAYRVRKNDAVRISERVRLRPAEQH